TRLKVFEIYIAMVLMFGLAASIVAIPLAISSGFAFARFVSAKLNFDILTTSLPFHLYLYLAAAGLVMPILFSLSTLLKGVRVSVQEALSDYGIGQESPARKTREGGSPAALLLPTFLVFALRNTFRRKRRLMVTVATMALGVAIFSTGFNVRQSLWKLLFDVREAMKYD